ncbi:MAG: hypothetical protein HZA15_13205 [Nitrospirae bacterium]|nr:hypothetical protein [Nitrospirota bacterium]
MKLRSALVILIVLYMVPNIYAEEMKVSKIILGRFKSEKNNVNILPKSSPYWPRIDRHNLAVDDIGQIYILNLASRHIMVFNPEEKLLREIQIPIDTIRKKTDSYGKLAVSGDGKQLYVNIPSQGKSYEPNYIVDSGLTLNNKGEIVKKEGFPEVDIRLCDGNYVFFQGSYLYDKNFNILKQKFSGFGDKEGKYRSYKGLLTKTSSSGKKLWKKQFYGNFAIIGIDASNYVYVEGGLKKGDPNSLYKLDSKGNIIEQAPIPNPFPFKTQAEKDEWEMHSSEEFFSFFKVACNGDVYLIYQLGELPEATFKRWLNGGEYFIYKFESVVKEKESK